MPKKYEDLYQNVTNNTNRRKLLGMASIMDEAIGNLTDALIKKGIYNDTLIIFTSDVSRELPNSRHFSETGTLFLHLPLEWS